MSGRSVQAPAASVLNKYKHGKDAKTLITSALRRELLSSGMAERLVKTLISCAIDDREEWAFKLIFDRIEGPVTQKIHSSGDGPPVNVFLRPAVTLEEWVRLVESSKNPVIDVTPTRQVGEDDDGAEDR